MATLKYINVNKVYDNNVQAVFDFNLEVKDKEFIVFVGPSGCGKSTTLRMTAGLERITSGEVYIDDVLINDVEPKDRDIAMVFQNYALYPHMTVYRNMAFALELKKLDKEEIDRRVKAAAEILGLTNYLDRKPKALSGGQRQRVALGRAIVRHPKVFLMDEPLSNLDAKLRVQMRTEISKIHKQVGATTIYVTHDQTEAMTMADRIVVMKDGYIQQIGTPKEVYSHPANVFVGGFIGSPSMNFLNCVLRGNKLFFLNENGEAKSAIVLNAKLVNQVKDYLEQEAKELPSLLEKYESTLEKVNESNAKIKKKKAKRMDVNSLESDIAEIKARIEEVNRYNSDHKEVRLVLGVRPEHIYVDDDANNTNPGEIITLETETTELLGHELIVYTSLYGQRLVVKTVSSNDIEEGENYSYRFDMNEIRLFDALTGKAI